MENEDKTEAEGAAGAMMPEGGLFGYENQEQLNEAFEKRRWRVLARIARGR